MELLTPKFRFGIYLTDTKVNGYNKNSNQPTICFAESYEISNNGSIIFYQALKMADDKKVKIPVLSYPAGKWDACVLLDDQNKYPVFIGRHTPLGGSSVNSYGSPKVVSNQDNEQDSNELTSEESSLPNIPGINQNNMPGINQNNSQEFKKQKDEWLVSEIKNYSKKIELFTVNEFIDYLKENNSQFRLYKPQETEIEWCCSKLIREKQLMTKKFYNAKLQKVLNLNLPNIMKRQWDGKMSPILEVLQDMGDTKNTTSIDLAVWMVQNNFE